MTESRLHLPERIAAFPFARPLGLLTCAGTPVVGAGDRRVYRSVDVRERAFPHRMPAWIAVANAGSLHTFQQAAPLSLGQRVALREAPGFADEVIGLARVVRSRVLRPADIARSFHYEPGAIGWELDQSFRFHQPIPLARFGVRAICGLVWLASDRLQEEADLAFAEASRASAAAEVPA